MRTPQWTRNAFFYHIYPLGLLGAPERNALDRPVVNRLVGLDHWLGHIQTLGANAIYLGPVFQSTSHGYDTIDYKQVDRRLGHNRDLAAFANNLHSREMRLVLDGVFNHVGRDFWAFKDLLAKGEKSEYREWFHNIQFDQRSPKGDPFAYEGWHGHYDLVKLNLSHPDVREYLFSAVKMWMSDFEIDGLRLDAADCIDLDFLRELRSLTQEIRDDFWLMGEVVHGDYRTWANASTLHSVTNYECYKGLYSSLLENNYFEIAYALNRQFGPEGIYKDIDLYNFVDNHDVDRVASKLKDNALLYPLYLLLFTMPGIPSIYYGSEWGIEGVKGPWSDVPLRPALSLDRTVADAPEPNLAEVISQFANIRKGAVSLLDGSYQPIHVSQQQFVFQRQFEAETVLVFLNRAPHAVELSIPLSIHQGSFVDLLNEKELFSLNHDRISLSIPPHWGRVLKLNQN
jgi:cyclomaltodextrinase / maltogenic alpha-amylase / neopullulanase